VIYLTNEKIIICDAYHFAGSHLYCMFQPLTPLTPVTFETLKRAATNAGYEVRLTNYYGNDVEEYNDATLVSVAINNSTLQFFSRARTLEDANEIFENIYRNSLVHYSGARTLYRRRIGSNWKSHHIHVNESWVRNSRFYLIYRIETNVLSFRGPMSDLEIVEDFIKYLTR